MRDKTIRILHSVSNMDRGGIETMLMNYYRHIDRERVQFDFLCNKTKPGAYDEEIIAMGGRIFHSPGLNPLKYPKYIKYMKNLIKEHPEYKIIHAHNGAMGAYALNSAKRAKVPVRIFHAHGTGITKDIKFLIKFICKNLLKFNLTHRWTCGNAAAKFFFGRRGINNKDCLFVPNAIEIERFFFNPQKRDSIRKKHLLEDKFVVGHVGRLTVEKNHIFLIDVFAEFLKIRKNAQLVLVGDGSIKEQLKQYAKEKKLEKSILFVGEVDNTSEWYNAFDLFVMPSLREGLPVVAIEAQTAGLNCIFSKNITNEVAVTDRAKFLELEKGAEFWAEEMAKYPCDYERIGVEEDIFSAGYDIRTEAKKLQEKYISLLEELNE